MASNRLAVKEKHYSWAIEAAARSFVVGGVVLVNLGQVVCA